MSRNISVIAFILLITALLICSGCGPKQRAAEGLLDTPESHYNQGMRKFEQGDFDDAQAQFEDALLLDAKYAPAHAGLSLVYAEHASQITDPKSKERKTLLKKGEDHLDEARDLDDKDVRVWIAQIRFYTISKKGDKWLCVPRSHAQLRERG